jgi:hypothetical protein
MFSGSSNEQQVPKVMCVERPFGGGLSMHLVEHESSVNASTGTAEAPINHDIIDSEPDPAEVLATTWAAATPVERLRAVLEIGPELVWQAIEDALDK